MKCNMNRNELYEEKEKRKYISVRFVFHHMICQLGWCLYNYVMYGVFREIFAIAQTIHLIKV